LSSTMRQRTPMDTGCHRRGPAGMAASCHIAGRSGQLSTTAAGCCRHRRYQLAAAAIVPTS
jgi:hypothetical protein